jgi:hypothetical protein
MASPAA